MATTDTAYDGLGRITRVTDPLSNYVVTDYDAVGRVTRSAAYDSGGTAVSEVHVAYDNGGRATRQRRLLTPGTTSTTLDAVTDRVYDDAGRPTSVTRLLFGTEGSAAEAIETFVYDDVGNMLTKTSTDAPTSATVYDDFHGRIKQTTDPAGLALATSMAWDDIAGRLTRTTRPDSTNVVPHYTTGGRTTLQVTYDSSDNALAAGGSLVDAMGRVTKTYRIADPANRLTFLPGTDPAGVSYYSDAHRLTRSEDPIAGATTYDYDTYGRSITVTDPVGNKQISRYDAAGRVVTRIRADDSAGGGTVDFTTAYHFDALNRATKTIGQGPDGDITATTDNPATTVWFDAAGRVTMIEDPKGTDTATYYDDLGRLTRKTEDFGGNPRYTDYTYDRASRLTLQTGYRDGTSSPEPTAYAYNNAGVKTRVSYPDNEGDRRHVEFFYDAAFRMISKVDQNAADTTIVYDSMGRPTSITRGTQIDTLTYTERGKPDTAQRGTSGDPDATSKSQRWYDGLGRLTREAQSIGTAAAKNVDYDYDAAGNVVTLTYPGGTAIERLYDQGSRLTRVTRGGTRLADYDYFGYRVRFLTYETGANDVIGVHAYDGVARMNRVVWVRSGSTLPDLQYVFDKAGNILTKTHAHRSGSPIEAYASDDLYRLTRAHYAYRSLTHGFAYDDVGNQLTFTYNATQVTYHHNDVNEITKIDATQVYYDTNGNLTKDADGYTYHYDRQNKLTNVRKSNDATDVASYAYDALGRRIEFIDEVNAVTKRYYHDSVTSRGERVLEEYDAAGTPARQRYYVWGRYVDELLVINDDAGGDSNYVVLHNHLFSPEAQSARNQA